MYIIDIRYLGFECQQITIRRLGTDNLTLKMYMYNWQIFAFG